MYTLALQISAPNLSSNSFQPQRLLNLLSLDLISEIFMHLKISLWPCLGQTCHSFHGVSKNLNLWQRKLSPNFPKATLKHLGIEDLKQIMQLKGPASLERTQYQEKINQITSIYKLALNIYLDPEADPKLRVNFRKLKQVLSSCFPSFWALYIVRGNKYIYNCFDVYGLETVMKGGYGNFLFGRNEVLLTDQMIAKILQSAPPIPLRTFTAKEYQRSEMRIIHYLVNYFTQTVAKA